MKFLKALVVINTVVFGIKTYLLIDGINFTTTKGEFQFLLFEATLYYISLALGIIFIVKKSKLFWILFSLLPFLLTLISLF
jgi:hypothetical protein